MRSLYDPVGLKYSSFTNTSALPGAWKALETNDGSAADGVEDGIGDVRERHVKASLS